MSLPAIGPNHNPLPTKPTAIKPGPNFGNHHVKHITGGVMGVWEDIKHTHNSMSDTEQGYYYIAAICVILVLLLLIFVGATGGIAALGIIAAKVAYYPFVAVAAGCILRGRYLTSQREPWQMPRIPSHMQGNTAAESEFKRLWDARNQAKLAFNNVTEVVKIDRARRDVTREEMYAKDLIKSFEKAEVDFWQYADEDVAYENR